MDLYVQSVINKYVSMNLGIIERAFLSLISWMGIVASPWYWARLQIRLYTAIIVHPLLCPYPFPFLSWPPPPFPPPPSFAELASADTSFTHHHLTLAPSPVVLLAWRHHHTRYNWFCLPTSAAGSHHYICQFKFGLDCFSSKISPAS